jgi:hypothetical protein
VASDLGYLAEAKGNGKCETAQSTPSLGSGKDPKPGQGLLERKSTSTPSLGPGMDPKSGQGLLGRKSTTTPSLSSGMEPKSRQERLEKKLTPSLFSRMDPKSGQGLLERKFSLKRQEKEIYITTQDDASMYLQNSRIRALTLKTAT